MSNDTIPTERRPVESPRSIRARTEPMTIALRRTGGLYEVRVASGRLYDVDVSQPACTCPDWQARRPRGGCKHLRRVDIEIKARTVPGPNGRLPVEQARTEAVDVLSPPEAGLITGPHIEHAPDGVPTGSVYYRCSRCTRGAIDREDVHDEGACLSRER